MKFSMGRWAAVAATTGWMMVGGSAVSAATLSPEQLQSLKAYDFNQPEQVLGDVSELVRTAAADAQACAELERSFVSLLTDDQATFACKQFICRKLWMIGSDISVPALARLLPDEKLGDVARYALERNASDVAGAALREALGRSDGKALIGLVDAVGMRHDAKAVAALGPLARGADDVVASAAVTALGRIGTAEALAALKGAADSASPIVARALIEAAYARIAAGDKAAAGDVFGLIQSGVTSDSAAQIAAFRGLLLVRPEQAVPVLVKQIESTDERLRRAAAQSIREVPGAEMTRVFAGKLHGLPAASQVLLLGALAARGDVVAVPAVMTEAESKDEAVCLAAFQALGTLPATSESVALLLRKAAAGQGAVAEAARRALIQAPGWAANSELQAVASNAAIQGGEAVRVEAIRALGARGARQAVGALTGIAGDASTSDALRNAALDALDGLVDAADYPKAVELLDKTGDDRDTGRAEKIVLAAARKSGDADACAKALVSRLPGASVGRRGVLLRLLGKLGGGEALRAVDGAAGAGDAVVRDAAVRALADWPDASALEALIAVVKREQPGTLRAIAFRGASRLMGLPNERSGDQTLARYRELLSLAGRDDEKRQVLSGLAHVGSPGAYALVEPLLANEALRDEATLAMAQIARVMASSYADQARAAAEKILATSKLEPARQAAKETIDFLERNEDFVTVWWMSEIYEEKGKGGAELFDIAFPPEKDAAAGKWRVVAANDQGVILNLDPLGGDNRCVYLKAVVSSPEAADARLEIGSDDGVKVWVNGKLVHAKNAARPVRIGEDTAAVHLEQGENVLMLKVCDMTGNWGACCRVRGADGTRLKGLSYKPTTGDVQGGL